MHYLNEQNIFLFLVQVFFLLGLARLLGEFFQRWKLPPLTAEILVGVLWGPTIFGRFFPSLHQAIFPVDLIQQNMLETVAWMGVFFLLLDTGLEIDFSSAWTRRKDALKIAVTGIVVPMVFVFICSLFLPARYLIEPDKRIIFSLFLATVMSITALPIAARVLYDLSVLKTDFGLLTISALSVNDILGWLIFTFVLVSFTSAQLVISRILFILILVLGFGAFCLTVGRYFTNKAFLQIKTRQMPEPKTSLTFICLLGLFCGAMTQRIGTHALFGFLIAGMMAGGSKALPERTRHVISQMIFAVFVPLFFASIGLKIDFARNFDLFLILFVTILGIVGKFFGAWLGAIWAGLSKADRFSVAIAHTPGGTMAIVVGILALENHLISETVFVAIVFGAVLSSIILGPWFNYSIMKRKKIGVLEYFSQRTIIEELKATDRDAAIEELCELASLQGHMPLAESLTEAVLERENTMGTALEEGTAIPHARFPTIKRPLVIFGRSIPGIEWNSPDGKSSHFIFLILTPKEDNEVQIQILRAVAKIMVEQQLRNDIMKVQDGQKIWSILKESLSSQHIVRK